MFCNKKWKRIIFLIILSFFSIIPNVDAAGDFYFCQDNTLKVFKIVGYLIVVIKILIPLLLIVFGSIDFGKAVMANDEKEIKVATDMLVKRAIAGVIIFFIPTILKFAFSLVSNSKSLEKNSDLISCTNCLLDVEKCDETRKKVCTKKTCVWDNSKKICSC